MRLNLPGWSLYALLAVFACLGAFQGHAADPLPTLKPEEIVKKVMERTKSPQCSEARSNYVYTKHVLTEELDDNAKVTQKKEKTFLVQGGIGVLQSMKVDGKPVSEQEMKKENKQAIEARQKITGGKSGKSDDNWDQFLNSDLTARYEFTVLRQEVVNQRPAYVLDFHPKSGKLPVKKLVDRVLNQMTGTIWIDGQDFEIAKAVLNLQSKVALGGVMELLGALKQFRYTVERVRVEDLVWVNQKTKGEYEGRKLWDTTHIRTQTESTDFHRATAAQSATLTPTGKQ